jgi:hypothetical protein
MPDQMKTAVIEQPVASVVENSAPAAAAAPRAPRADGGKRIIELGPKNVVRASQPTPSSPTPRAAKPTDIDNPLVKPGEVKWHASFQAACDAAKKSHKPVLLFHMMGQLDRQFC